MSLVITSVLLICFFLIIGALYGFYLLEKERQRINKIIIETEEKMRMLHDISDFKLDFAKGEGSLPLIEKIPKDIPKIKTDFADKGD